jgi:hypothetical protein
VSYKTTEGAVVVELAKVGAEVSLILFTICGQKPFSDEGKIDAAKNKFDVFAENSLLLFTTRYKKTARKNGLLWFALSRDGFGGWALTYARISLNTPTDDTAVSVFATIMQRVVNS